MQLEIGSYYLRDDGVVVGPIVEVHDAFKAMQGEYIYFSKNDNRVSYRADGKSQRHPAFGDLVGKVNILPAKQKILKVWTVKERRPENNERLILLTTENSGFGTVSMNTVHVVANSYYTPEFTNPDDEMDDSLFDAIDALDDIPYEEGVQPPVPVHGGKIRWELATYIEVGRGSTFLDANTPYILTKDAEEIFGRELGLTETTKA